MLFGQMMGILPPVLILPGLVAVLASVILASNGWRLPTGFTWQAACCGAARSWACSCSTSTSTTASAPARSAPLVNELRAATAQLERARDAEAN